MQNKFYALREKHPIFTYDRYEILDQGDQFVINYYFHLGEDITFRITSYNVCYTKLLRHQIYDRPDHFRHGDKHFLSRYHLIHIGKVFAAMQGFRLKKELSYGNI